MLKDFAIAITISRRLLGVMQYNEYKMSYDKYLQQSNCLIVHN